MIASQALVVVAALGATTAASYALSGLVDWQLTALLIGGGVAGSVVGRAAGRRLATRRELLQRGFAALVIAIGIAVAAKGVAAFV